MTKGEDSARLGQSGSLLRSCGQPNTTAGQLRYYLHLCIMAKISAEQLEELQKQLRSLQATVASREEALSKERSERERANV